MEDNNPNQYRLPKRINEPLTLFIWPIHYVLTPMMCVGFGLVIGKTAHMLILGVAVFVIVRWTEARYPKGFLNHILWWNDIAVHIKESRWIPSAVKRNFYN